MKGNGGRGEGRGRIRRGCLFRGKRGWINVCWGKRKEGVRSVGWSVRRVERVKR